MQFFYGDKNILRALDEAQFWKHQEKEHTVVIREIAPNLEQTHIKRLEEWELSFSKTEGNIVKFIESVVRSGSYMNPLIQQQIFNLVKFSAKQSQEFVEFLNMLKVQSQAVSSNPIAKTVIDHIIRESQYFIGIAQIAVNTPI